MTHCKPFTPLSSFGRGDGMRGIKWAPICRKARRWPRHRSCLHAAIVQGSAARMLLGVGKSQVLGRQVLALANRCIRRYT